MVSRVAPAPPDGQGQTATAPPLSRNLAQSVQLDDPPPPVNLTTNLDLSTIDPLLQKCTPLNRLFIRRHPLNNKRFDIIDEDGIDLYQLHDCSKGSKLNYILKDAITDLELVTFTGTTSFLGRNGEIVARYSAPKDQSDSDPSLSIGTAKQVSKRCSLKPKCSVYNTEGNILYDLLDKDKTSILNPSRQRHAPNFEIKKHGGLPVTVGHIDERRLVVNEAVRTRASYSRARRSVPAVSKPSARAGPRLSIAPVGPVVLLEVNDNQDNMRKSSLISTGTAGSGRIVISHSMTEVTEKPTHDHFCVAFMHSMDYKMKIMMIAAHLLVNDDLVRRNKTCTRRSWAILLIIFLFVAIMGTVGLIVCLVLLLRVK